MKIALISNINLNTNTNSTSFEDIEKTALNMFTLNSIISKRIDNKLSDAKIACNNISVEYTNKGIIIKVEAFKDMARLILTNIIDALVSIEEINKKEFDNIIEDNKDYLELSENQKSHMDDSSDFLLKIIKPKYTSVSKSIYDNSKKYDYQTYMSNIRNIVKSLSVNFLIYGSVNLEESSILVNSLKQRFIKYLSELEDINNDITKNYNITKTIDTYNYHYKAESPIVFEILNSNSKYRSNLVLNSFLIGNQSENNIMLSNLLKIIWGNIFYTQMKNFNNEINNINANLVIIDNNIYLQFTAESNNINISHESIDLQLDKILSFVKLKLEDLTLTKFNDYKNSYRLELLKKDNSLIERSEKVWSDIMNNSIQFDTEKDIRNLLKSLKLIDLKKFFDEKFIEKPSKISLYLYNQHVIEKIRNKNTYYYLNSKIQVVTTQDIHFFDKENS